MRVIEGDCLTVLKTLPDASVDCVITDPPYPHIKRSYGVWTEAEWWDLMMGVCAEVRRILKPTGSAVFILQPNSKKVGSMRGWLFKFQAWACDEWNMVQDAWWWNYTSMPSGGATEFGLMRGSLKAAIWCGPPGCYRDQQSVLWGESERNVAMRMGRRIGEQKSASGRRIDRVRCGEASVVRGGVTPFNVLPIPNSNSGNSAGAHGHGAGTPLPLMQWWARYICPPGGTVLDPFAGSGTAGIAALREGRDAILIERKPEYVEIIHRRLAAEQAKTPLFEQLEVK